jgi:hypothetical protein
MPDATCNNKINTCHDKINTKMNTCHTKMNTCHTKINTSVYRTKTINTSGYRKGFDAHPMQATDKTQNLCS